MLHLKLLQEGNKNATIEIRDDQDRLRCDVYVELPADDDWRAQVKLVVTDDIVERDSDDVSYTNQLMQKAKDDEKFAAPGEANAVTLDKRELGTVLAAVRLYQTVLSTGKLPEPEQLRAIHDIAGHGEGCLTPEDMDELCERINTGG